MLLCEHCKAVADTVSKKLSAYWLYEAWAVLCNISQIQKQMTAVKLQLTAKRQLSNYNKKNMIEMSSEM